MTNIKMGLTIEEAAEMSGIGRNTMRKLVDWGKLPVLKVGRKTIIRRDALENFMTVNQGRNLLNQADVREVRYHPTCRASRSLGARSRYSSLRSSTVREYPASFAKRLHHRIQLRQHSLCHTAYR